MLSPPPNPRSATPVLRGLKFGRACNERLAEKGMVAVVADIHSGAAEEVALTLRQRGYESSGVTVDVADVTAVKEAAIAGGAQNVSGGEPGVRRIVCHLGHVWFSAMMRHLGHDKRITIQSHR